MASRATNHAPGGHMVAGSSGETQKVTTPPTGKLIPRWQNLNTNLLFGISLVVWCKLGQRTAAAAQAVCASTLVPCHFAHSFVFFCWDLRHLALLKSFWIFASFYGSLSLKRFALRQEGCPTKPAPTTRRSPQWWCATSTVTLRGRRGAYGTGLALVADKTLPHNFVTDSFHTQLCHTSLSHTTLSHTTLSHTTLSHTTLFHTQLFHTQLWSHTTFSHTTLLRTQTYTHNTFTQLFHPTCLAPSPFLPAFPISFSHLLVIIGRSWFVGLSGPLILHYFLTLPIFLIVSHSFFLFCCFFWVLLSSRHVWRFLLPAAFWPRVCRSGHALALEPLNLLAAYEHLSATYSDMFQPPLGSKRHKVSRYFKMFHGFKTFQQYQYPSTTSAKLVAQFCTVPHEMSGKYWKTTLCPIVCNCAPTTEAGHSRSEASSCASAALWASNCSALCANCHAIQIKHVYLPLMSVWLQYIYNYLKKRYHNHI